MEAIMLEKRKHPRQLTLKTAKIHFDLQGEERDCAIVDISEGGACVMVEDDAVVPDSFDLTLDRDGLTRSCKVVWRAANRLGLSFSGDKRFEWRVL
jgi:hypothetical protein